LALTFIAAVYAGIEAHRLADWTMTAVQDAEREARRQAGDTSKQLGFMQQQLDTMKVDQRPWVGLGAVRPIGEGSGPSLKVYGYSVAIANAGKSPALKTDIALIGGPGDCSEYQNQIPKQRCEGDKCKFRNVEILPGADKASRIPRVDETANLAAPEFEACFIVRADYEDADGGRQASA
jgi:hypothetical protein